MVQLGDIVKQQKIDRRPVDYTMFCDDIERYLGDMSDVVHDAWDIGMAKSLKVSSAMGVEPALPDHKNTTWSQAGDYKLFAYGWYAGYHFCMTSGSSDSIPTPAGQRHHGKNRVR